MTEKYIKRIFTLIDMGIYNKDEVLFEIYSYLNSDSENVHLINTDAPFLKIRTDDIDMSWYYDKKSMDIFIPNITEYFIESARRFNISLVLFVKIIKVYLKHKLNL